MSTPCCNQGYLQNLQIPPSLTGLPPREQSEFTEANSVFCKFRILGNLVRLVRTAFLWISQEPHFKRILCDWSKPHKYCPKTSLLLAESRALARRLALPLPVVSVWPVCRPFPLSLPLAEEVLPILLPESSTLVSRLTWLRGYVKLSVPHDDFATRPGFLPARVARSPRVDVIVQQLRI